MKGSSTSCPNAPPIISSPHKVSPIHHADETGNRIAGLMVLVIFLLVYKHFFGIRNQLNIGAAKTPLEGNPMSAKHACNTQTYTRTKAGASPVAKAASLVLAAGLALPTVLPTMAHAQSASSTQESTPSLHKAAEANSRSAAALIRQSLQNAKTAAELQAILRSNWRA